jgi:hypothetical protein
MFDDDDEDIDSDVEEMIDELVPVYEQILEEQELRITEVKSEDEARRISVETQKKLMKVAFLSNPLASPEDFERLWPQMFDDSLVQSARATHALVMSRMFDEEEEDDDDFFGDEDEDERDSKPHH